MSIHNAARAAIDPYQVAGTTFADLCATIGRDGPRRPWEGLHLARLRLAAAARIEALIAFLDLTGPDPAAEPDDQGDELDVGEFDEAEMMEAGHD